MSTYSEETIQMLAKAVEHLLPNPRRERALLGFGDGATVEVADAPYMHWVRIRGDQNRLIRAFNIVTAPKHDLPVYVVRRRDVETGAEMYYVTGVVEDPVLLTGGSPTARAEPYLPRHHKSHERRDNSTGSDAIDVYLRMIAPLRVQACSTPDMYVRVTAGVYMSGTAASWYAGEVLGPFNVPASGVRLDLVYFDPQTGGAAIEQGTEVDGVLTPPVLPEVPAGTLPLASVLISSGTSAVLESHIKDLRPLFTAGAAAGEIADHDHSGDAGDGGQLEAAAALLATGITDGYVLTADGAGGVAWEAAAGEGGGSADWISAGETWNYASATSFIVSGDVTGKYAPGMKVRLKQGGGYTYFYIISLSYSAPNTTINVTGGSDYSLANAAITDNYYSVAAVPAGFPDWFNYTPSWTATTTNPTRGNDVLTARFHILGRQVHVVLDWMNGSGFTQGSGAWIFTVPVVPARDQGLTGSGLCLATWNAYHTYVPTQWAYKGAPSASFRLAYSGGLNLMGADVPWNWSYSNAASARFSLSLAYDFA